MTDFWRETLCHHFYLGGKFQTVCKLQEVSKQQKEEETKTTEAAAEQKKRERGQCGKVLTKRKQKSTYEPTWKLLKGTDLRECYTCALTPGVKTTPAASTKLNGNDDAVKRLLGFLPSLLPSNQLGIKDKRRASYKEMLYISSWREEVTVETPQARLFLSLLCFSCLECGMNFFV